MLVRASQGVFPRLRALACPASFHTSSLISNVGGHMVENEDTVEVEAAKQRELKGKGRPAGIPGMEGWEHNLASVSEAAVKAEKVNLSPEELQKLTVEEAARAGQDTDAGRSGGVEESKKV